MSWGFPALSDLLMSMLLAPERAPHQRREPGKLSRGFLLDLSGCIKPGLILPLPDEGSYPRWLHLERSITAIRRLFRLKISHVNICNINILNDSKSLI